MNIGVIGGDLRLAVLVNMLENKENKVFLYGLEKCELLKNKNHISNLEETIKLSDVIITSIPLSKDGKYVNTVFTDNKILIKDLLEFTKNKKIITGNITNEISKIIEEINAQNQIVDILNYEQLTICNAISTAEGAIQIAMEKSLKTLHSSKCLVLGFGRIGKILSKMLYGLGAKVYCEARKQSDLAWINSYGYNAIHLKDLDTYLAKFDFIFNTIPYLILDKEKLSLIKKDCVLIDLASKPGGIDFKEADKLNLENIWALALPGKVAPKTSAKYIYEVIKNEKIIEL